MRYRSLGGPPGFQQRPVWPHRLVAHRALTISFFVVDVSAHTWQIVAEYLASYLLLDLLPPNQFRAFCSVMDVLRRLAARQVVISDLPQLKADTNVALTQFYLHFPLQNHTAIFHLASHLVDTIARWGPLSTSWQYSIERYLIVACCGHVSACVLAIWECWLGQ